MRPDVVKPRSLFSYVCEVSLNKRNFFVNPNTFLVQGFAALVVGGLHLFSYDKYVSKLVTPAYKLFKQEIGYVAVMSHAAWVFSSR